MAASLQTSNYIPYPSNTDEVDIAGDLQLLAEAVIGNKGNSNINVVAPGISGLSINATSTGNAANISHSGSGVALKITNTGTGNSFVVEDESGDTSPFTIDNNGYVSIPTLLNAASAVFSGSTSTDLVRITQTGTGNALVVEDSTNPDTTPFAITSTGWVGIGTTSPSSLLHIESDASSVLHISTASSNTAATAAGIHLNRYRGTQAAPTIVSSGDWICRILFQAYDGTDLQNAASIRADVDGTPNVSDMPGRLGFFTTTPGTATLSERMRIDSAGNIGIGTTATTRLHVSGGKIRIDNSTQTNNGIEIYDSATAHGGIGLSAWALGTGTTADIAIKSESSKAIRFYTNGSNERAVISSGGNLGIGLSNPSVLLHVSSNIESDMYLDTSVDSSVASAFSGRKSRGTAASPTAVQSGDSLATFAGIGHNGTAYGSINSAELRISATENHTPTAQGAEISLFTVPNTTIVPRLRFRINNNGDLYVNETTSATPLSTNVYTTAGTGTNIAGSDITFNGGQSTGSANGGTIHFKTSVAGASGASLNALATRLSIGATSNLLSAGTTTFAPLQFTSGTNLTTPLNGGVEYDGDKLYVTPNANTSGRGYIPSIYSVIAQANSGAATTTTPVTPFTATNDVISIDTNKLYFFKGTYYATSTWTSGAPQIQIGFTFSNAPVAIKYKYRSMVSGAGTAISLQGQVSAVAATAVTGTIGASNSFIIEFEGYFTSNATTGGTFSPFFQMSTAGVSTVMTQFSQFDLIKLGPASITTIAGNWA
jgi:hypothetical protein